MMLRNLGRGLMIGVVGLGLSAAQAAVGPGRSGNFRGDSGERAAPARFEGNRGGRSFRGTDRDDGGRGFDRGRQFRDHDFNYGYGPGWYGWDPGFGWGFGSPYWGAYPGYYYSVPSNPTGHVKIETPVQDAKVYIDGAFVGTVHDRNKLTLDTGVYQLEVLAPNGDTFNQKIDVLKGETLIVRPEFRPNQPAAD